MNNPKNPQKGIALLIVLTTILIVVVLASVMLTTMSSQSRLTHHQVTRTQGYYAAQAGMVYAIEKLKSGEWVPGINCTNATTNPCNLTDPDFPSSVRSVSIVVRNKTVDNCNPPGNATACIDVAVNYTYQ